MARLQNRTKARSGIHRLVDALLKLAFKPAGAPQPAD